MHRGREQLLRSKAYAIDNIRFFPYDAEEGTFGPFTRTVCMIPQFSSRVNRDWGPDSILGIADQRTQVTYK